jgi:hypothetical protein
MNRPIRSHTPPRPLASIEFRQGVTARDLRSRVALDRSPGERVGVEKLWHLTRRAAATDYIDDE